MKKPSLPTILCLLFLLCSLPSPAQTITDHNGASLTVPPGWTQGDPAEGATLILFAPNPQEDFRPNINLMVQDTGAMTAEEYRDISQQQVEQIGGWTEGFQAITLDDGSPAHFMIIHFPFQGQSLTSLSVWVMRDGRTYLITGTALPDDFSRRLPAFLGVARTFRLGQPPRGGPHGDLGNPLPSFGSGN